jgi:hypothetical protein
MSEREKSFAELIQEGETLIKCHREVRQLEANLKKLFWGRAKAKSCLGWVLHFMLGSFSVMKEVHGASARPSLINKTQLRFCPVKFNFDNVVQYLSGENLKVVWCWVFHLKLGSFSVMKEVYGARARPSLIMKTQRRFCPVILTLTMYQTREVHIYRERT